MMSIVVRDRKYLKALTLGAAALALVMPILIYSYLRFRPTNPDIYTQAQDILINYRIPHHAKVVSWISKDVLFQIAFITLALYLVRQTKLFPVF